MPLAKSDVISLDRNSTYLRNDLITPFCTDKDVEVRDFRWYHQEVGREVGLLLVPAAWIA